MLKTPANVPQLRSIISGRRCQPLKVTLTTEFKDCDYSRFVETNIVEN